MSGIKNGHPDDAEPSLPEALLPWYATGRLSPEEKTLVENALASDEELRRRLTLVEEEAADTIGLNESLRTPPAVAMDRLMAKIDLYDAQHPKRAVFGGKAMAWLSETLSAVSPHTLAWSATAAAFVICLEAGLLTRLIAERHEAPGFKTASLNTQTESPGAYALVSFVGTVPLREITTFLLDHHAVLIEGPKPGGFYRIKIADENLSGDALNTKLAAFRAEKAIVSMILPEAPKP